MTRTTVQVKSRRERAGLRRRGLKLCYVCKAYKSLGRFGRGPTGKIQKHCLECRVAPDEVGFEVVRRLRKLGISPVEVKRLVSTRDTQCCEICGAKRTLTRPLNFDHSHATLEFRGLLCDCCNRGIGMFHDDPELLLRAIAYLREKSRVKEQV